MFYVQGFYKIKRITKCNQYKNALKKFLLSEFVKAIFIATPNYLNYEYTMKAIKKGKQELKC